jgi:hypothetical protein
MRSPEKAPSGADGVPLHDAESLAHNFYYVKA